MMMSMQAASLEILEKADVPAPQARAIVQAIEIEIAGAKDTLATKHDILLLRHEMADIHHGLELKIEGMRGELKSEMTSFRGDLKGEITSLRGELKGEIASIRSDFKGEITTLRGDSKGDITTLRGELKAEMASLGGELRAEMHGNASSIIRQMYTAMLGQMAVLLGVAYFFVTHLVH